MRVPSSRAAAVVMAVGATAVLLGGCAAAPPAPPPRPIAQEMFAAEAEVDLDRMQRHPRGFYWREIREGHGRQGALGQTVQVAYVVRLPDGREVDRADPEHAVTFRLGERRSIAALELALREMRVGGIRQLVVPPDLAYGSRQRGPVPPNSTLVMIVSLLKVG